MDKIPCYTVTDSPIGRITLVSNGAGLCGLYNEAQRHWPQDSSKWKRDDGSVFDPSREWLGEYFSGNPTNRLPEIDFRSGTDFQMRVWRQLLSIPYGKTISYAGLAGSMGNPKAVRAVAAAVGRNPISIVVPCHRVIGGNGSLTGYAGGLEKKRWLLEHEAAEDLALNNSTY